MSPRFVVIVSETTLQTHSQRHTSIKVPIMHRRLLSFEILSIIFEYVYGDPYRGIRTTASSAVTCQPFREPALDILWRSLPSLAPLVKCLPRRAWTKTKGDRIQKPRPSNGSRPSKCGTCSMVVVQETILIRRLQTLSLQY